MRSNVIDTINNDDRLGATFVIDPLVELGHRHIWHIDGGRGAGAVQRRAGYEATMRKHGLEPHVLSGFSTQLSAPQAAERAVRSGRPVTAIFAGNDLSVLGALDAIGTQAGLKVPDDISLVGYDNTFVAALIAETSLPTTVDQPRATTR